MIKPITFLRQVYEELLKVKWPTRNDVIRLTTVVAIISLALGFYIGALDYILTELMSEII